MACMPNMATNGARTARARIVHGAQIQPAPLAGPAMPAALPSRQVPLGRVPATYGHMSLLNAHRAGAFPTNQAAASDEAGASNLANSLVLMREGGSALTVHLKEEAFLDGEISKDEPEEKSAMMEFVESKWFSNLVFVAIILNTVVIACEADASKPSWMPGFQLMNSVFGLFFLVEISLRLSAYGCAFFTNEDKGWNIFDFVIVCLGLCFLPIMIISHFSTAFSAGAHADRINVASQIGRVSRLTRLLRTARLLRSDRAKFVVDGMRNSIEPTYWATVIFFVVTFMYAVVIVNVVKNFPRHSEEEDEDGNSVSDVVFEKFGNIPAALQTLFTWLTFDDWGGVARTINSVFWWMEFVWISFMMLSAYTFLSLITGIMADQLNEARLEAEEGSTDQLVQDLAKTLERQFEEADKTNDDLVDLEEFKAHISASQVQEKLDKKDVQVTEVEMVQLFNALDANGSGKLSRREFVTGFTRVLSEHTSQDIMVLEGNLNRLEGLIKREHGQQGFEPLMEQVSRLGQRAEMVKTRMVLLEQEVALLFKMAEYNAL
ncbi:unnamed protein product [Prorocentrum cordatum]|uniref:EF-hand domain-containing protein n=1 Tax=Prorocentrum cordatum TaxID=2364126 RepID=A0ABN9UPJ0_9DINO|nr:unnamed protein product [Polarella glacialis]